MQIRSDDTRWGVPAQFFHWTVLLLIVALGALGLYMTGLPLSLWKEQIYLLHKSLGIALLGLVALRLLWRLVDPHPAPPDGLPRWQHRVAQATHAALYLLLLAIPISGWVLNSASGFPLRWFGLLQLPALTAASKPLAATAVEIHKTLFWVLVALVAVHAAAALLHHYHHRNHVLRRMLPWGHRRRDPGAAP